MWESRATLGIVASEEHKSVRVWVAPRPRRKDTGRVRLRSTKVCESGWPPGPGARTLGAGKERRLKAKKPKDVERSWKIG